MKRHVDHSHSDQYTNIERRAFQVSKTHRAQELVTHKVFYYFLGKLCSMKRIKYEINVNISIHICKTFDFFRYEYGYIDDFHKSSFFLPSMRSSPLSSRLFLLTYRNRHFCDIFCKRVSEWTGSHSF